MLTGDSFDDLIRLVDRTLAGKTQEDALNKWDCQCDGCHRFIIGVGSAIGIRAVGWYYCNGGGGTRGPTVYCPEHRPDPHGDGPLRESMDHAAFYQRLLRNFGEL